MNADKTELLWAGSRHSPAVLGSAGPSLQLKTETVMASDQVRVIGVTMSSDLSLERSRDRSSTSSTFVRLFLLASSAQTGPTFTRRGVCGHAGPRFRDVTRRLLQCHSRGGIQVYHRQAPASYDAAARVVTDTRGSTIADSPISSTTSCTGSTFPSGCNTSCVQRFIAV